MATRAERRTARQVEASAFPEADKQEDMEFSAVVLTSGPDIKVPEDFSQKVRTTIPSRLAVYRVELVRDGSLAYDRTRVATPALMGQIMREYIGPVDREYCIVIMLDTKFCPIGINTVSVGSLNAATVHPREVFKPAILANAHAIIVAHNHPSSNPEPSHDDLVLTTRLKEAGDILGIRLIDHVIVPDGDGAVVSLHDRGLV